MGHELNANASFFYSPRAKTTLVVVGNTVAARAAAQLATTVQMWTASTLTVALRATSGSTIDVPANHWFDGPDYSAIVAFALGVAPF